MSIPQTLTIGPIQLYTYWLATLVAFASGYWLANHRLMQRALPSKWLSNAWFWVLIAGVTGSEILPDIALNVRSWLEYPLFMLFRDPASYPLSLVGALVAGTATAIVFIRSATSGRGVVAILDTVAPVVVFALAVARALTLFISDAAPPPPRTHSVVQLVEYVSIYVLTSWAERLGSHRVAGLTASMVAALLGTAEFANTYASGATIVDAQRVTFALCGSLALGGGVLALLLLRRHLLQVGPDSHYALADHRASQLLTHHWRFSLFALAAAVFGVWGYNLADIKPAPRLPQDWHTIQLYTSDPAIPSLLHVTLELGELYVTPIIDVPAGESVEWVLLIQSAASPNVVMTLPYTTAPCWDDPIAPADERTLSNGANVWSQQLFRGQVTGPTMGSVAAAEALPQTIMFRQTGPLAQFSPVCLFDGAGNDFEQNGHKMATFPQVGFEGDYVERRLHQTEDGWVTFPDPRPDEPVWHRPRQLAVHVEYRGPFQRTAFDLISPQPLRSSLTQLDWTGQVLQPQFDARDLEFQDAGARNNFLAGILIAVGASAMIAAVQEIRPGSTQVP